MMVVILSKSERNNPRSHFWTKDSYAPYNPCWRNARSIHVRIILNISLYIRFIHIRSMKKWKITIRSIKSEKQNKVNQNRPTPQNPFLNNGTEGLWKTDGKLQESNFFYENLEHRGKLFRDLELDQNIVFAICMTQLTSSL